MVTDNLTDCQFEVLDEQLAQLKGLVVDSVTAGTPDHEFERVLLAQVLAMGHQVFGCFLREQGNGDVGESLELPDGRTLKRFQSMCGRRLVTIFREFRFLRVGYGIRERQAAECIPLDQRLQLPESVVSYVLQDWVEMLAVEVAFASAVKMLETLLGVSLSGDSAERVCLQMAVAVDGFQASQPAPPVEEEGQILVATIDHKGIPMVHPAAEPAAAAHRTKGKKPKKQMAAIGCVYSVEPHVRSLACMAQSVVARRRPGQPLAYLTDGQRSLKTGGDEQLPADAVEVLDLMHVLPRLWEAAHLFYEEGSEHASDFVRDRLLQVLKGKASAVVVSLRHMGKRRKFRGTQDERLTRLCDFLHANVGRMRYDTYLEAGFPIATGVIEGACRHVIKDRMERAGMRWKVPGAQAMLKLRTTKANESWKPFQAYRIEQETKRLYPHRIKTEIAEWPVAA